VHTLPSLQDAELSVNTQPVAGLQESVVQALLSLQTLAVPGWQLPPPHVSPVVQALPSLQALVLFEKTHPVAGLQLSFVHPLLSLQTTAAPGWHVPPPQRSPDVHAFASSQGTVLFVNTHPVAGLQLSVVQGFESAHDAEVSVNTHPVAGLHESAVHALPSLHEAEVSVWTHPVAESHESAVHALPSSQLTAAPGWQLPPPHVSPDVQALASSQGSVLFAKTHPVAGLQLSSVHPLPSPQMTGAPGWQTPPAQVSPTVHALPSSQADVLFV